MVSTYLVLTCTYLYLVYGEKFVGVSGLKAMLENNLTYVILKPNLNASLKQNLTLT